MIHTYKSKDLDKMTYLNSVGSVIDVKMLIVYPINSDDTIDMDNGVSTDDLSDEWVSGLSKEDISKLTTILD